MSIEDPSYLEDKLARGVIHMANLTELPLERWKTDQDIKLACEVLGWSPEQAKSSGF